MNIEIKIKFLKDVIAPQAVYQKHCKCCGFFFDGWRPTLFLKDQEINPDDQYDQVDIRGLKLGEDFEVTSFLPDKPVCY